MSDTWEYLEGKFFHTLNEKGGVERQGQFIAVLNNEAAVIQYFDWFVGGESWGHRVEWINRIVNDGIVLYDTDEAMRDAYDNHWRHKPS